MTITIDILNLGDSVNLDLLSLSGPPKANFAVVDTKSDPEKGTREAVYQKLTGSEDSPMTVRVGHYVSKNSNDGVGQTNVSIKITTFVEKTDEDDVIWTLPGTATLALSMPGRSGIPRVDQVKELINHLMIWFIPVVAGVMDDAALDELKFGVVGNLAAHADSASS
jgi:hypothetical protein